MIKINRISSPLKDKIKNLNNFSQLDGDGVFEGKYNTSGSLILKNSFIGELSADQVIIDEKGSFKGKMTSSELIVSGKVDGSIKSENIIIMGTGHLSGEVSYLQIAVFEGGIIDVAGLKPFAKDNNDKVIDLKKNTKV